ncbi:putative Mitochondrial thiamine diphosphate carrier 2 [Cocos nucifera]|uniref:Putative Mitochondrial thiamine diphosphate carrier 2 n=1 Tax=Cocos nucifera TaxID=13894 RepID=A0A8K0MZ76_COCNU|nr:putative Mitochondrial thiamine diphosphate carrier 2 [Cocos nucifera]
MPISEASSSSSSSSSAHRWSSSDADLGFGERAISAAGAAVVSAILVNPLDVAKTRLQAQAAGLPYDLSQQHAIRCYPSCNPGGINGSGSVCPPDCFQYRGTLDVFYKVVRQELEIVPALLVEKIIMIRRSLLGLVGEEGNAASVLGANFSAGFVAGSLAAAATCPLDVAKTRCQIEKDPAKVLKMTTRGTLAEIWRKEGVKGTFTGVGPRVGRAGPSVGIVVSFYEIVKYALHGSHANS